jgi:hypothetical protein
MGVVLVLVEVSAWCFRLDRRVRAVVGGGGGGGGIVVDGLREGEGGWRARGGGGSEGVEGRAGMGVGMRQGGRGGRTDGGGRRRQALVVVMVVVFAGIAAVPLPPAGFARGPCEI